MAARTEAFVGALPDVAKRLAAARRAQAEWASQPVRQRLKVVRLFRHGLARRAGELTAAISAELVRSQSETLVSEVLPLAEACRFLERRAEALLKPKRLSDRDRPFWLNGVETEVRREPRGVVLILSPYNYPCFLPGVQMIQALTAGNAVLLKPGRGGLEVAGLLLELLADAGLPPEVCTICTEAEAKSAMDSGVDQVLLTGSATSGIAVLRQLAETATPAVMELSGCDAVFVRSDADLDRVVAALRFGWKWNGGATCIAPRRVFVHRSLAADLEGRLVQSAATLPLVPVPPGVARQASRLIDGAILSGARIAAGKIDGNRMAPMLLVGVSPEMELLKADLFAPVLSLMPVDSDQEALAAAAQCPYALGASVFGREAGAKALAERVPAGSVVINDLIVPTADPRLPFGGRGRSGFGMTRGEEGLLELTVPKAIAVRRGRRVTHLEEAHSTDRDLFAGYLALVHGGTWRERWQGCRQLFQALRQRGQGDGNAV